MQPRNVAVVGRELAIAWSDGTESYLPLVLVRQNCPCAACVTGKARTPGGIRTVAAPPDSLLAVEKLEQVGAYGLRILWTDRHGTGIYTWDALRALAP